MKVIKIPFDFRDSYFGNEAFIKYINNNNNNNYIDRKIAFIRIVHFFIDLAIDSAIYRSSYNEKT